MLAFAALVGLLLAYANGANDNFKGVATLFGSGTTEYRRALVWATLTTALGSVTALMLARGLLQAFTGKGLVPPEVVGDPIFPVAVALAAGLTVLLATRLGFPISTTHVSCGSLFGIGAVTRQADWSTIGTILLAWITTLPLAGALAAAFVIVPRWVSG